MTPAQQRAVIRTYEEGASEAELVEIFNLTPEQVRALIPYASANAKERT
jgi:uncharacterized protein (DUF433 family)